MTAPTNTVVSDVPAIASGGCRFCDAGSIPVKSQDGTPWQDMGHGGEVCEKPDGVEARRQFIAAIAAGRN